MLRTVIFIIFPSPFVGRSMASTLQICFLRLCIHRFGVPTIMDPSGGFRKGGSATGARSARENFWVARPLLFTYYVTTDW